MSSPPRRSGFRLPWASQDSQADKTDGSGPAAAEAGEEPTSEQEAAAPAVSEAARDEPESSPKPDAATKSKTAAKPRAAAEPEKEAEPAQGSTAGATAEGPAEGAEPDRATKEPPAEPSEPEPQQEFLRDLVTAMRGVAEQTRQDGLQALRTRVDERVARFKTESEENAGTLRQRADADVVGIGEWAKAETERIKSEAETRVAARRQQLEQQLAAAERRAERDADEVRRRVAEYESELDAYFIQLGEITDPAAFAAAAKRMPRPPEIDALAAAAQATNDDGGGERTPANAETAATAATAATEDAAPAANPMSPTTVTSASTVVVKGLTSFGSITAFKQSLEAVDGVNSVTLSLGPTGEFVYRALHNEGFDLQGAIAAMERGAAAVERQPDGTLQVKMGRGR